MRVNTSGKKQRPGENSMPPKRAKQGQTTQTGSILSGLKLNIEVRPTNTEALRGFFESQPTLSHGEDRISMFKEVLPQKYRDKALNLDTGFTLKMWEPLSPTNDSLGWLTLETGGAVKKVKAYKKVMPLVDAMGWMRYKERPSKPFFWSMQPFDILEAENQAYVDCIASYMASKLKERIHSPHFCTFYGCVRAVVNTYLYNLEEDFEDFRFTKWFWQAVDAGEFQLQVIEKHSGRRLTLDEIKELSKPDDEFLHDDSDSESDSTSKDSDNDSLGAESLPASFAQLSSSVSAVQEVKIEELPFSTHRSTTPKTVSTIETASTDSEKSFGEEYSLHAEFKDMPVAIQYIEACEGTFESLLDDKTLVPIQHEATEQKWTAWLFQVCVALTQLQNALRLTHNDLHSSNVLWKKTDQEYLYYADSKGRKWRVPTYGYIFTIIDYGRSIFCLNNFFIISSDYNDGHDACGMYNFGPIEDKSQPRVGPNPSFDLCRLACDMLRVLYPTNPPPASNTSKLITKEGTWEVRETNHAVFNLLWTWLKTKQDKNVLENESGEEKYPGFDLYAVIAKDVGDAVPEIQFSNPIFKAFEIKDTKGLNIQPFIVF